eukprot:365112-Chlamydomonas_euryale.AAC.8
MDGRGPRGECACHQPLPPPHPLTHPFTHHRLPPLVAQAYDGAAGVAIDGCPGDHSARRVPGAVGGADARRADAVV